MNNKYQKYIDSVENDSVLSSSERWLERKAKTAKNKGLMYIRQNRDKTVKELTDGLVEAGIYASKDSAYGMVRKTLKQKGWTVKETSEAERRKAISEAHQKRKELGLTNAKPPARSAEWRRKQSEAQKRRAFRNISEEHKQRISRANSKSVQTPNGLFTSLQDAANELGMSVHTLKKRTKDKPEEYYIVE